MIRTLVYIISIALLVTSCSKRQEYKEYVFFAMGTIVTVTLPKGNDDLYSEVVEKMHHLSNLIVQDSERASGESDYIEVSETTYRLLQKEISYRDITPKFNSATFTIARLYGFPDNVLSSPPAAELEDAIVLMQNRSLNLKEEDGKYFVNCNGLYIYLGAFAKGWIVDEVSLYLRQSLVNSFIINAGGDMFASGMKVKDKAWRIGIIDPNKEQAYVDIVSISNLGLATSGGYERYFYDGDKRITHIFDGLTGESVDSYKSVSVIADSSEKADAFSTILFLLPLEEVEDICTKYDISALIVTSDNKLNTFCDWKSYNKR